MEQESLRRHHKQKLLGVTYFGINPTRRWSTKLPFYNSDRVLFPNIFSATLWFSCFGLARVFSLCNPFPSSQPSDASHRLWFWPHLHSKWWSEAAPHNSPLAVLSWDYPAAESSLVKPLFCPVIPSNQVIPHTSPLTPYFPFRLFLYTSNSGLAL